MRGTGHAVDINLEQSSVVNSVEVLEDLARELGAQASVSCRHRPWTLQHSGRVTSK